MVNERILNYFGYILMGCMIYGFNHTYKQQKKYHENKKIFNILDENVAQE